MTNNEKNILNNLMERTLVHVAWSGRCNLDDLYSEYLAHKSRGLLFKFSDVHNSFYDKKSDLFTTHELDVMKYSVETIFNLLIEYSKIIAKRYPESQLITPAKYDHFASRFWSNLDNEKKLTVLAPDLWFP